MEGENAGDKEARLMTRENNMRVQPIITLCPGVRDMLSTHDAITLAYEKATGNKSPPSFDLT
jgi:hypothetical protein